MSQNNDLISREALLKEVRENKELYEKERVYLEGLLLNAPTVERPQGEWIFEEDIITFPGNHLKCSNCGFFAEPLNDGNLLLSSFCPYCGAKMKDWYPKRGEEE